MSARRKTLGIIAGNGDLPGQVAARATATGYTVFFVAIEGHAAAGTVAGHDHCWVRLGAAQAVIDALHGAHADEVVMVGGVGRPTVRELAPDLRFGKLIARAGLNVFRDDFMLTTIVEELRGEGFTVRGPAAFLADDLAPAGAFGTRHPDQEALQNIARGGEILDALADVDVAQAVVIQAGLVLGIEAIEGTDQLMARCGALRRPGPGPVLVKFCKIGQTRVADLPTIGPATIARAAAAGFAGIAVEAGGCLLVDRHGLVAAADLNRLFLWGVTRDSVDA